MRERERKRLWFIRLNTLGDDNLLNRETVIFRPQTWRRELSHSARTWVTWRTIVWLHVYTFTLFQILAHSTMWCTILSHVERLLYRLWDTHYITHSYTMEYCLPLLSGSELSSLVSLDVRARTNGTINDDSFDVILRSRHRAPVSENIIHTMLLE